MKQRRGSDQPSAPEHSVTLKFVLTANFHQLPFSLCQVFEVLDGCLGKDGLRYELKSVVGLGHARHRGSLDLICVWKQGGHQPAARLLRILLGLCSCSFRHQQLEDDVANPQSRPNPQRPQGRRGFAAGRFLEEFGGGEASEVKQALQAHCQQQACLQGHSHHDQSEWPSSARDAGEQGGHDQEQGAKQQWMPWHLCEEAILWNCSAETQ
eukprot:CAMPEP_0194761858 /NCGR_PEP_ID=MMETSP0323_2-20130528/14483_1 /TAXON_ID=2866 ORGANISM="Crypthecodinium cohnii, Strain Seligo" /NCGR_SAMPLE_ID=MMETSP0323_2 /ASSEMBLY_ACC=CAM_ASM_000346 /LENGTH=209 /DNA_ID=CAMNT_0039683779 /DNA_START=75 /DNA_END=701 /DNA_ORIENTATION=-